jgi:hypothetical protein
MKNPHWLTFAGFCFEDACLLGWFEYVGDNAKNLASWMKR